MSEWQQPQSTTSVIAGETSTMRVAVAGTGGLARLIAHSINDDTSHQVTLLSREPRPELIAEGYQVSTVDYADHESLKYALRGIDTIICTVTGPNQVLLIHAAAEMRVRRFAAADFEGLPSVRSANDALDCQRTLARQWLASYSRQMQYTSFVCGIFYERFQPGGLRVSRTGSSIPGLDGEGDYIMNCRTMAAEIPACTTSGQPDVFICLTSMLDVARFVRAALDLRQWDTEMTMCGDRMTVQDLAHSVEVLKGQNFQPKLLCTPAMLQTASNFATTQQDFGRVVRMQALVATAEGRYDYPQPSLLNTLFPQIAPMTFRDWFVSRWNQQ